MGHGHLIVRLILQVFVQFSRKKDLIKLFFQVKNFKKKRPDRVQSRTSWWSSLVKKKPVTGLAI